jgi:hypothetical protein
MNCCYITDFWSEFCSFIISVIVKILTNFRNSRLPGHGFWKKWSWEVMEKSWNFKWEKVYEPCLKCYFFCWVNFDEIWKLPIAQNVFNIPQTLQTLCNRISVQEF